MIPQMRKFLGRSNFLLYRLIKILYNLKLTILRIGNVLVIWLIMKTCNRTSKNIVTVIPCIWILYVRNRLYCLVFFHAFKLKFSFFNSGQEGASLRFSLHRSNYFHVHQKKERQPYHQKASAPPVSDNFSALSHYIFFCHDFSIGL